MGVIETLFDKLKSGDMDGLLEIIHPDAVIIGVREQENARMPIYGTYRGPEGMRMFVGTLRTAFETELFEVGHIMETDGKGFACGRFRHKVRHTGRLFESAWALYAEIEDGKLSLYRFFEDTAALEASFGISTALEMQP